MRRRTLLLLVLLLAVLSVVDILAISLARVRLLLLLALGATSLSTSTTVAIQSLSNLQSGIIQRLVLLLDVLKIIRLGSLSQVGDGGLHLLDDGLRDLLLVVSDALLSRVDELKKEEGQGLR